jgi:hypothetical protein
MKTTSRLATFAAMILLVSGCTGMRHKEKALREPVKLPGAPTLEPSVTTPPAANMPDPTMAPLSAGGPSSTSRPALR